MKSVVEELLKQVTVSLQQEGTLPMDKAIPIKVERSKDKNHGDYATNLALILAKSCQMSPQKMAELLVKALPSHESIEKIEIAGVGFINFFMKIATRGEIIKDVLKLKQTFGHCNLGQNRSVLIEFVSANPTGPLHVGHGRSAAFGASLANILSAAGFTVSREYYVNDAGRQMNILAVSVWMRYLALYEKAIPFPVNGYQGSYVQSIAHEIKEQFDSKFVHSWSALADRLPADETAGGDKEQYIDALIKTAKSTLGEGFDLFHQRALASVLSDIKADLSEFGVEYDSWFSEQTLLKSGAIEEGIKALTAGGHTYTSEGALWFRATAFGDEKDRVLVRANGENTYFAADVAYHWNKYHRKFKRVLDIFGADHHGYIHRIKAAVHALGHQDESLDVLLVQFAILYRGEERVQMSTRSGSFVTLRELREEVGNDAARFFYVMRKPEQHMDFDLELAKSESNDNPVYYIQYAHARISSVLRQLNERGLREDETLGLNHIHLLVEPQEEHLINLLHRYPEMMLEAAKSCEPHQVAYYLRELANGLHSYYNAIHLLCEPQELCNARLCLLKAVRQVLRNGMELLGVSAPESM